MLAESGMMRLSCFHRSAFSSSASAEVGEDGEGSYNDAVSLGMPRDILFYVKSTSLTAGDSTSSRPGTNAPFSSECEAIVNVDKGTSMLLSRISVASTARAEYEYRQSS